MFGLNSDWDEDSDEDPDDEELDEPEQKREPQHLSSKKLKKTKESKKAVEPLQMKYNNEQSDSLKESIMYWQGNDEIPTTLDGTKKILTEVMGLGASFDIAFREMSFGGQEAALVCITGFTNDAILDQILKRLTYLTPLDVTTDVLASFIGEYIPHLQVEKGKLLSESVNKILKGMSAIFVEGESQVILMDVRSYPMRSPSEPTIERVVRGARDGFTETLLSNVSLVRRRIRDPGLKYELHSVGRRTRTDVCVAYIDDIADIVQVKAVIDKIKTVDIDGIPLADKQLEEAIMGGGWNPYPLVRYSERPDVVASHLLEGRIVLFVDTSPSVIVLPTTFFDLCQHAEENRQTPFIGSYLRWVRFIGVFSSMFLLPLWMLLVLHPELKPAALEFIGPQKMARIPLLAQFLFVEFGVDLLRMAAVHTPTPLGSAMGLIAAILIGDIAVQTGLFVNEVVLYMAVAAIGMFATPSYELGLANRIVRLVLLLAVSAFQVPGFVIGSTLLVVLLTLNRSYNSSYLWPFIPFNAKGMGAILLRKPVLSAKLRPSFNKTTDNTRVPQSESNRRQS
ncbi:spore germination protein [Paenibacillus wynnii]|uniref:spore germination protein n=1 Tax=Paenibacillus wynnii TaxID=268407 RepID=UPI00359339E8